MPGTITPLTRVGSKRVLQDVPARQNVQVSPSKRRKLEPRAVGGGIASSQPKSRFEEEVLEKLTQDINGLKQSNAEKDQHWARPSRGVTVTSLHGHCVTARDWRNAGIEYNRANAFLVDGSGARSYCTACRILYNLAHLASNLVHNKWHGMARNEVGNG
jgi:hypothetical protein